LSAHSPMRRTSIFVVVLLAVSAVAAHGSQAEPAHTHRKASASARGAHKAGAANVSSSAHASSTAQAPSSARLSGAAHGAGSQKASTHKAGSSSTRSLSANSMSSKSFSARGYRRGHWRTTSSDRIRAARYMAAVVTTEDRSGTGDSAAYKNGYEAGRAAALEQMRGNGADYAPAETDSDTPQTNTQSTPLITPQSIRQNYQQATPRAMQQGNPQAGPQPAPQARSVQPGTAPRRDLNIYGDSNGGGDASDDRDVEVPATRPARADAPEIPEGIETASLNLGGAGMISPLRGSLASLTRQNTRLDADGLERIEDEADLTSRIEHKLLVPLPASTALVVNPNLSDHHRYCRSWTARFLADLARAHEAAFHKPIEVNSAVRTVEYQRRLMHVNGNAAPAVGDIVSPHLTGATVDIAKQGLSRAEMAWMRSQLLGLQNAGKIDVEEEFEQACFHITVYKNYVTPRSHKITPAAATEDATTQRKPAQAPSQHAAPTKPSSQLPAALAVGGLTTQG